MMTQRRVQWILTCLTILGACVFLYAQNPVSIAQLGTGTTVTTTLPVSGTVSANATQTGTWTVQPGNTANTTPWLATVSQGGNAATVSAGGALKVDNSAVTQPVSGTVTSNQGGAPWTINQTQWAGTAVDVNSGNKSAGTLRVVLATDQPQLTNKLLVTPDSVALPANQSVNVAQMNGVATTMNNGVAGTGVQRVAVASDNSAIANWGHAATGAAPPANVTYVGGLQSGATGGLLGGFTVCDLDKEINVTANTQLITGTSGRKIRVCSIQMVAAAATNVAIVTGTGSTCGTGTTALFGGTTAATGWNFAANGGIAFGSGLGEVGAAHNTADNLCILVSAANQISGSIKYTIY